MHRWQGNRPVNEHPPSLVALHRAFVHPRKRPFPIHRHPRSQVAAVGAVPVAVHLAAVQQPLLKNDEIVQTSQSSQSTNQSSQSTNQAISRSIKQLFNYGSLIDRSILDTTPDNHHHAHYPSHLGCLLNFDSIECVVGEETPLEKRLAENDDARARATTHLPIGTVVSRFPCFGW
jgi:hypothetical protein